VNFWDDIIRRLDLLRQRRSLGIEETEVAELEQRLAMHPNPAIAKKYFDKLWMGTQMEALAAELNPKPVQIPDVHPDNAVSFGSDVMRGRTIQVDVNVLTQPTIIAGATGSGKTTAAWGLIKRLCEMDIIARLIDHKGGEGTRVLNLFRDALVIKPHQITQNIFDPPVLDQAELFFATTFNNLGNAYSLLPSNFLHVPPIMMRVLKGLKPGEPRPSAYDLANILRKMRLEHQKFGTTALAIDAVCVPLRDTGFIRQGVTPSQQVQAMMYFGLPNRAHQFLSAQWLLRERMETLAQGFTSKLRRIIYSDEGLFEFGKKAQHTTSSGYLSSAEVYSTQMRAYGFGIMLSVQSLADLDDSVLSNYGTLVVMRTPAPAVAKFAAELLQLPSKYVEVIQSLPVGQGLLRSVGFSGAVLVQFPYINAGPYLSDAEVDALMAPKFATLERDIIRAPAMRQEAPPIFYMEDAVVVNPEPTIVTTRAAKPEPVEIPLRPEHFAMLRDIHAHRSSVGERYQRLRLSAGRGNRIKDDLTSRKLITSHRLKDGNGRPRVDFDTNN
jgi:hypothetical protein